MDNKEKERQVLWIIPNDQYEDIGLHDGEALYYKPETGDTSHSESVKRFHDKYFPDDPLIYARVDFGSYLAKKGFTLFINSVQKLGGKLFGVVFMPEKMTDKQIKFLEDNEDFFSENCHNEISFFEPSVYTSTKQDYRQNRVDLRDLRIESIIDGNPSSDGVDLLYREVSRQKEELHKKVI